MPRSTAVERAMHVARNGAWALRLGRGCFSDRAFHLLQETVRDYERMAVDAASGIDPATGRRLE